MTKIILFNKPYEVLTQFTDEKGRPTLANFLNSAQCKGYYAAGRLDFDSEGLLILTDDGKLQRRIADPAMKLPKTYWAQVEGDISEEALQNLRRGVSLKDGLTKPAKAQKLNSSDNIWPRTPPIRERAKIPTSWISLTISEGKNRQVRRMTAAVGFPTLRLIRYAVGHWTLEGLAPGEFKMEAVHLPPPTSRKKSS